MSLNRNVGDQLEAERIACQCRKHSQPRLIRGAGGHRAVRIILQQYAYCVIEKPLIRVG